MTRTARNNLALAGVLGLVAGLYRAWLTMRYWGSEEEDWGGLVVIKGVLDSGFRYVETEHMPLFFWLSAAATALTGDPERGGQVVAVLSGAVAVSATAWLGARWLSPTVGLLAGLIVAFQPGCALYAATPLREPTYTALLVLGVLALGEARGRRGGAVAGALLGAAFLTRFDAAFSVLPFLALWAAWADLAGGADGPARRRRGARRVAVGVLAAVVVGWALYYFSRYDTLQFWGSVAGRNSGDAVADLTAQEHVSAALGAVLGLLGIVLPGQTGHAVPVLGVVGAVVLLRRDARAARPELPTLLAAVLVGGLALLVAVALRSTYDWRHNLYWKWLTPLVPFLALFAAQGLVWLGRRLGWSGEAAKGSWGRRRRWLAAAVVAGLVVATIGSWRAETHRQLERSRAWYGSQVRLVDWLAEAWPPGTAVVADAIPAWVIEARGLPIRLFSWRDAAVPRGDQDAFGAWIAEERVGLVIWFAEEWVGAKEAAPFLGGDEPVLTPPALLLPIARQDEYGFVAYVVTGAEGVPIPSSPPPIDAGASGLAAP